MPEYSCDSDLEVVLGFGDEADDDDREEGDEEDKLAEVSVMDVGDYGRSNVQLSTLRLRVDEIQHHPYHTTGMTQQDPQKCSLKWRYCINRGIN